MEIFLEHKQNLVHRTLVYTQRCFKEQPLQYVPWIFQKLSSPVQIKVVQSRDWFLKVCDFSFLRQGESQEMRTAFWRMDPQGGLENRCVFYVTQIRDVVSRAVACERNSCKQSLGGVNRNHLVHLSIRPSVCLCNPVQSISFLQKKKLWNKR